MNSLHVVLAEGDIRLLRLTSLKFPWSNLGTFEAKARDKPCSPTDLHNERMHQIIQAIHQGPARTSGLMPSRRLRASRKIGWMKLKAKLGSGPELVRKILVRHRASRSWPMAAAVAKTL